MEYRPYDNDRDWSDPAARTGGGEADEKYLEVRRGRRGRSAWFTWYRVGDRIHLVASALDNPATHRGGLVEGTLLNELQLIRDLYRDARIESIRIVLRRWEGDAQQAGQTPSMPR